MTEQKMMGLMGSVIGLGGFLLLTWSEGVTTAAAVFLMLLGNNLEQRREPQSRA